MNHTFSGSVLLSAIVLCTLVLFVVAYFIKPKPERSESMSSNKLSKTTTTPKRSKPKFKNKSGDFTHSSRPLTAQLSKLKRLIGHHFPEFNATCSKNHIILERTSKKVALLTLDKAASIGRRRLGEVVVINFHHLPSVEELKIELSGV